MHNAKHSDGKKCALKWYPHYWAGYVVGYVKRKIIERDTTEKYEPPSDRSTRKTANATRMIAFLTAALLISSLLQWNAIKRQIIPMTNAVTAAKNGVKVAENTLDFYKQQLADEERPWIALDTSGDNGIISYGPLAVGYNGTIPTNGDVFARFVLRYSLKNFGRSPAYVDIGTSVVNNIKYPLHDRPLLEKVQTFCDEDFNRVKKNKHPWPCTVVPGTSSYNVLEPPLKIPRGAQKIEPTVIGCIWYRSTTGDQKIHKTPFSGNISTAKENGQPVNDLNPVAIPIHMGITPKDELRVVDVLNVGKAD